VKHLQKLGTKELGQGNIGMIGFLTNNMNILTYLKNQPKGYQSQIADVT
jgi:hypothetical protein